MVSKNDLCHDRSLPNAFNRSRYQSAAAPAVEFTTVPVIIRARSETRKTAAFAVSEVLAGVFRKFRLAILAIIWSLVTFILRQNVHRLLNHAAICVRDCAKRYHPDTCGTKFKRQVFRKRFNRPECRANCRRAFNMTTRGTARDKKDHAGALLHHLARGSARGDELRLNERLRDDKLSDRQVDSVLAIAVFSRGRANSIKEDVDTAAFRDTVDVRVDRRVIKSVDNRCMRAPAGPHDLLLYLSDVRLGATGKKNFSAFSRELFGDCPSDRTAGAEDN